MNRLNRLMIALNMGLISQNQKNSTPPNQKKCPHFFLILKGIFSDFGGMTFVSYREEVDVNLGVLFSSKGDQLYEVVVKKFFSVTRVQYE